jgi:RNA polymerase sigma factor (sigma-70 family)
VAPLRDENQARRKKDGPERASDLRLMALIGQGDAQAFRELYCIYQVRLERFLANVVRHPHIVEEVLDDTLMVVWERANSFRGDSKLSTWIFAIAYRKAMKALRRYDVPIEDEHENARASREPNPEECVGRERLREMLRLAMLDLSPEHRAVIEFTYYQELGYREIAEIMECPVDTVKTRMFYARRQLKRRLHGELPDWI